VKPWINEETFKTWTDAQRRLWDSLCSAVPFQPPAGVETWRETYLKNLATWESAVKKTLEQEVAWVEQWVHRVAQEKGTPEVMTSWVRQMEEVLQRWIQTQHQWWDEYFAVLRRGGLAYSGQVGAESAAGMEPPPAVVEPAVVPEGSRVEPGMVLETPVASTLEPLAPAVEAPVGAPVEALVEAAPPEQSDDLKLIAGIGPALEKKLHACGILSFRQLAALGDAEVDRVEAAIKSFGRIRRDDWIGQARARHFEKYREQL